MRLALVLIASLATGFVATPALAGDLGRIESSHSSGSSSSGSSSPKKSSGSGIVGSILGGVLSGLARSSSSSSGTEGDASPPSPPCALAMDSYPDDRSSAYAPLRGPDERMPRYGELSLAAFSTITPHVGALDAQLNVFLSVLTMHMAVTRYYEPEARSVTSLDLLRFQLGFNVFHGWVQNAELHITGGVLGLHGNEWTPGGSARADLRIYPFDPFTFDVVGDASFFAHGSPLFEGQVMPGATFARLDLRAGAGVLFQPGIAPILGPRIQAGIRF